MCQSDYVSLTPRAVLSDSLTVELSKSPGKKFYTKALKCDQARACQLPSLINMFSAFRIQTHRMFCDTTFNSLNTVLSTIYQNFLESAMKFYRYGRCISIVSTPKAVLLIRTY